MEPAAMPTDWFRKHSPHDFGDKLLPKQSCNLLGDSRDDRAVEDSGKGSQQQSAQNYGDDNLYGIRDVEVAALVGERLTGLADGAAESVTDYIAKFFHGKPPVGILICSFSVSCMAAMPTWEPGAFCS